MSKKLDLNYHLGRLAAYIVRPLFSSYRYQVFFEDSSDAAIVFPAKVNTQPLVYTFFHQNEFNLIPYFMNRSIVAMVSNSRDGSILAGAMEYYGFLTARGSSHRGGNAVFHKSLDYLKNGNSICIAVDGPTGPIYKVKHGAITLSQRSGFPIVPVGARAHCAYQFKKSWEKSYLPYPGSKIDIFIGKVKHYEINELEEKLLWCQQSSKN